jgi:hypothetical protein
MDDTSRLSISSYPGPGCTPNEPMALVVMFPRGKNPLSEKKLVPLTLPSQEGSTPFETPYGKRYEGLIKLLIVLSRCFSLLSNL